jgi:hypothetical protein
MFSKFSAAELEFFKTVLSEIVNSEGGCISSTVCLNLNSSLPGSMTKSDTEALLEKFCKYLWLYQKVCMMSHCSSNCYSNVMKLSGNKTTKMRLSQKKRFRLVFMLVCSLIYSALSGATLNMLVSS